MNQAHFEHRKILKAKKPTFIRQDKALKKLEKKWHRPKGLDSKRRLRKDGHQKRPSRGYSSPKSVKGLNPEGLQEILITNMHDLIKVQKENIAIISRTLGTKKRIEIVKKAIEQKIPVSNVNPEEYLKHYEQQLKEKKAAQKKEQEKKIPTKEQKQETKDDKEKKMKEEKKKVIEQKITT